MSDDRRGRLHGGRARRVREDPRRLSQGRDQEDAAAARRPRATTASRSTGRATRRPSRSSLGTRAFKSYKLAELVPYIDWTPFFQTWELQGKYPRIFEDNVVGAEAKKLFADAQAMLKRMVAEKWLTANAVIGFWPANARRRRHRALRRRRRARRGSPCCTRCASRWRARTGATGPTRRSPISSRPRRAGSPTTSARSPSPPASARPRRSPRHIDKTDDYGRIMLKALADRLAEAFAERMHERVRREFWGYAPGEKLSTEELIAEKYRGIRPAPGYPAQPDHTEKAHHLPPARRRGGRPASSSRRASPCGRARPCPGLYFSHPESHYFGVGKVERDQVEDYARAQGLEHRGGGALARPGAQLRPQACRAARRPDRLGCPRVLPAFGASGQDRKLAWGSRCCHV